ncbi:hypothetical protein BV22DRAFT_1133493 [Leucogyrophana mollusca]|uniref:Uncharacterized protein n=1 Tax=Leucogyrophana mollusca TaxID=85980 RepID=A0ACB8B3X8_9AGAM|nr:hypothetical protein BV22DRAFT_1133493 [Leucogyrophana mollusca]
MSSVVIPYSPDWWPTLEGQSIEDYFIVVTPVVIFYDYVITFSREVDLIWATPRSLMSALYIIGRFTTIGTVITFFCEAMSIFPSCCHPQDSSQGAFRIYLGPLRRLYYPEIELEIFMLTMSWFFDEPFDICTDRYLGLSVLTAQTWIVFTSQLAYRVIMILRIYAMYGRSKKILTVLVVALLAQVISYVTIEALYFGPVGQLTTMEFIIGNTFNCGYSYNSNLPEFAILPQFLFALLLFILAGACFVRHLLEARRSSNTWKVNEFLSILVKDNTIYFFLLLLTSAFKLANDLATNSAVVGSFIYSSLTGVFIDVQEYLLVPHLVLSFKERHARLVEDSDDATQMDTIAFELGVVKTTDGTDGATTITEDV